MARIIRWGKMTCPHCGDRITKNALGRASHIRWCTGTPRPDKPSQAVKAYVAYMKRRDAAEGIE